MKSNNPRNATDTTAPSTDESADTVSTATAAPSSPDATAEALLQAVVGRPAEPHPLQPDAVASVGELPRAPLTLDPVMVLGGSLQDGAAQIANALNAMTAVLKQLLPDLQQALAVTQEPVAPPEAAKPAPAAPQAAQANEDEDGDDDDAWKPSFIHMPLPPPSLFRGPRIPHVRGPFGRLTRIVQSGTWDEIEEAYRQAFNGRAMPEDVRSQIARMRKGMGLSGPPKLTATWPLPESTKGVPFVLTPEMLLAPLRADLAKHGKPGGQPPVELSDDLDADVPVSQTATDESAASSEDASPNGAKKPPSDMN